MRPYFVAELSANASAKNLDHALRTVLAAKYAGADAIKLQTWTPGTMTWGGYVIKTGKWAGRNLAELYAEAWTPWEWHKPIFDHARSIGLEVWSTPFDQQALDFLESLDCPRYKIASFEILDLRLIEECAATGKPVIISTGMASWVEIHEAVAAARRGNPNVDLTLLQCTSAYPAPAAEANLHTMVNMARIWNCRSGLSDHTIGIGVAAAAATMGASMIEKHFTMDRSIESLDADFSLMPLEFKQMTIVCAEAAQAVGKVGYGPKPSESTELRRGIYWATAKASGDMVTAADMVTARPATTMTPRDGWAKEGCKLVEAVVRGDPVEPHHFGSI